MAEATSRGHHIDVPEEIPTQPKPEGSPMTFGAPARAPKDLGRPVDQSTGAGRAPPVSEAERAAVMGERQRSWDAAEAGGLGTGLPEPELDEIAARPYQDVDYIEISFPNKLVTYGPRPGSNLSWDVAELLGFESANMVLANVVKIALCIRAINGKPVRKPGDKVMAKKVVNDFNERELDYINTMHRLTWPSITEADMPTIKTIFR